MTFHVGQKVVCIKDAAWKAVEADYGIMSLNHPVLGQIYTIVDIDKVGDELYLAFEELDYFDSYWSEGFRPVVTTDISIFKGMLVSPPKVREKA